MICIFTSWALLALSSRLLHVLSHKWTQITRKQASFGLVRKPNGWYGCFKWIPNGNIIWKSNRMFKLCRRAKEKQMYWLHNTENEQWNPNFSWQCIYVVRTDFLLQTFFTWKSLKSKVFLNWRLQRFIIQRMLHYSPTPHQNILGKRGSPYHQKVLFTRAHKKN